jgi:hypothetical protein
MALNECQASLAAHVTIRLRASRTRVSDYASGVSHSTLCDAWPECTASLSSMASREASLSPLAPVAGESVESGAEGVTPNPVTTAGWRSRILTRSLERATQRSLDRASAFIQAAKSLLDEEGAAGFTVQQVADLAGQSLRSFYQHFSSKDDLLLALFEEDLVVHAE